MLKHLNVIHIDQHSDIKENENKFSNGDIEQFVNEKTNVGNFITAALNSEIINEVIQVRTSFALESIKHQALSIQHYILDIDIDFREGKEITQEEIGIIRTLMLRAKLVTIATSPYFIDQKRAITLIQKILS